MLFFWRCAAARTPLVTGLCASGGMVARCWAHCVSRLFFFFFNDTATTEIYTLSLHDALPIYYDHLERAYHLEPWESRRDAPDWVRRIALVVTLHGMHYTGYVFNDYAHMLEVARWVATRIPPDRVLLFLPAWDGRYYWDYPLYRASDRLGGEAGLKRLIQESRRLGFRVMPMFGANAANRRQPAFARMADAATHKIDGDRFDVNWVDWDNDRHQEGWLSFMNLGVASWREWLTGRIAEAIERYGVDAYVLDIAGGWGNNPQADMHQGMRQLVLDLRARYPHVMPCGEMHYDALLEFIPCYQVGLGRAARYARAFSRSEEHTSELQSPCNLVCRLLLEKKK